MSFSKIVKKYYFLKERKLTSTKVLIYVHSNFQIKLVEVEEVELLDRRGYLVISITLSTRGEGKIYLRKTEGIRDWFNSLQVSLIVMNSTCPYLELYGD